MWQPWYQNILKYYSRDDTPYTKDSELHYWYLAHLHPFCQFVINQYRLNCWSYNKNNEWFILLKRSCEMFCMMIFNMSERGVIYHYPKQWTWFPQCIKHKHLILCCTIDCLLLLHIILMDLYSSEWFYYKSRDIIAIVDINT